MQVIEADGVLEEHIALQGVGLVAGLPPGFAADESESPRAEAAHGDGKIAARTAIADELDMAVDFAQRGLWHVEEITILQSGSMEFEDFRKNYGQHVDTGAWSYLSVLHEWFPADLGLRSGVIVVRLREHAEGKHVAGSGDSARQAVGLPQLDRHRRGFVSGAKPTRRAPGDGTGRGS